MECGRGLMLWIKRNSVERRRRIPIRGTSVPSTNRCITYMVAKSDGSDEAVLTGVREWVSPALTRDKGCCGIVHDTGLPKKGEHSVGVARQYCGQLGQRENCQIAGSLSLASSQGSLPIAFKPYLPDSAGERQGASRTGTRAGRDHLGHQTKDCAQADSSGKGHR